MLENTPALHTAEIVHWAALGIMGAVYTVRLFWLFKFNPGRDRQTPGDHGRTDMGPAMYSMFNVTMPWAMESSRTNPFFYIQFVAFHLGVTAAIALLPVTGLTTRVRQILV